MEKLENEIWDAWKELRERLVITIKDVEEIEKIFLKKFDKVARQRQRLEKSRDMWKRKFDDLKNKR